MGQLSAQCPHCRARMKIQKPELVGKTARCPACQEAFVIKVNEEVSSKPAAPSATKTSAAKAAPGTAANPKTAALPAKAPKAPSDIDFDMEDEEVVEAEVIDDDPGDEDWLNALDSLAPKDAGSVGVGTSSSAAPVVQGRPKRTQPSNSKSRKRQWRDADGEFPLWLSRTLTVAVGATVGLIAMMIWAGMISRTGGPIVIFPMFIGATVGTGVRLGASKWDFGLFPAVTAVMIALVTIIGGKVWGVSLLKHQRVEREAMLARYELRLVKHENYPIHLMAEEIRWENLELGIVDPHHLWIEMTPDMSEPDIADMLNPEKLPEVYGAKRWEEATKRWETLPEDRKREIYEEIDLEVADLKADRQVDVATEVKRRDELRAQAGHSGGALSVWDFIVAGIAVWVAFKIAAGMSDTQIDTSHAA